MYQQIRPRALFTLPAGRRAKFVTIALWVVALAIAVPAALGIGSVQSDEVTDQLPADADSTQVAELEEQLPGDGDDSVLVVFHREEGLTAGDRATADEAAAELSREYGQQVEPIPSPDGTTVMAPVSRANPDQDEALSSEFVENVRDVVGEPGGGLEVYVTGPSAVGADIDAVFEGIDTTLMLVSAGVVALLLIGTYRSPLLWLVPLLAVGVAAALAMAAVHAFASLADMTISTQSSSIMIVLVFGAGTDYALLVVARYREELHRHDDTHTAMAAALRGAGPAVLASASTVALGLLCMLAATMNDISGLGLIGAIGIVCALVTMVTLFPALLLAAGRRVFWPRVPESGDPVRANRTWARIADRVLVHPRGAATISAVVLGALSFGVFNLNGHLGESQQFTSASDSVVGYDVLSDAYPEQSGRPITVAATTGDADQVRALAADVPGVVRVEETRSGNGWTLLEATPDAAPDSATESQVVSDLREAFDEGNADDALVGGSAAQELDIESATSRDLRVVLPLVIGVVLLVLIALLRSLVAPLVVVGSVLLCFAAALGISALVFDHILGFAGNEPALPVLAFVFGVALGVDYSIFLVARVRDEVGSFGTREAVRRAFRSTGPVIVSAGVVLAATFAVLTVLPFVPIVEIGFVVAIGVLLQALLVQPLMLAPLLVALGDRAWWPSRVEQPSENEHEIRSEATIGA